jgi:uncharacterized protein (DUF1697 family)
VGLGLPWECAVSHAGSPTRPSARRRHTGPVPTFVVFLRAVNVAGRSVPMAALRDRLAEAGFGDVESYIQSGNLRLSRAEADEDGVAAAVEGLVAREFSVTTAAVVRTPAELGELYRGGAAMPDPFGSGARRYAALARRPFSPEAVEVLQGWAVPGERARVVGRDCFLWFTGPFHAAKLSNARIEKLGVVATTRDWKVVSTLAERWGE